MSLISRRQFLQMAGTLLAGLGWLTLNPSGHSATQERTGRPALSLPEVADTLETLASGRVPLLWLHGQACSGCSVSFLDATYPDVAAVLTQYVSLEFHDTLSAATGATAMQTLNARLAAGNYTLVVEGAVPAAMPRACEVGGEPFTQLLTRAAQKASTIIALGTCAAFGGIPAAPPNPTGAVSVSKFLGKLPGATPLINLPGCPAHPDWLIGTLVYLLKVGQPALNQQGCPELFYKDVIHNHCLKFYDYNAGRYAGFFGDSGCLFKLGCLGIRTYAECSTRRWNNRVNWCVEAGAPCIGCARPEFAQDVQFPFYRIREQSE